MGGYIEKRAGGIRPSHNHPPPRENNKHFSGNTYLTLGRVCQAAIPSHLL